LIDLFTYSCVSSEKETKLREGMRMVGMTEVAYWVSWITTGIISLLIPLCAVTGILIGSKIFAGDSLIFNIQSHVPSASDYGFVFFFYFLYLCTLLPLTFFLSAFINKARYCNDYMHLLIVKKDCWNFLLVCDIGSECTGSSCR
jgi:hypothetical protein